MSTTITIQDANGITNVISNPSPNTSVSVAGTLILGGSSVDFVFNETPAGLVNGSNATFTSAFDFIPESVKVEINGLGQKKVTHFNTIGNDIITLNESPLSGDQIQVHYIKL